MITTDRTLYHFIISCDDCDVMIATCELSRAMCQKKCFDAGWRLSGKRQYYGACVRKKRKGKTK